MTPAAHREAAGYLQSAWKMSERRACRVIGIDRTSVRDQATRPDDGALRERLKALAQERRRFGYRRLHILLLREGHAVNRKRVQRLYREERLTVRRRGGRKRAMGTRRPIETPLAANQRWSLDFVSDQMTDGRSFRILTVIDNCMRECLALVVDTSLSGRRVARGLAAIIIQRGAAGQNRQRQRNGIHLQRHPRLGQRDRRGLALHRAGQAPAERLQRELQRLAARRADERDAVPVTAACPRRARDLAAPLQRKPATLEARMDGAPGICQSPLRTDRRPRCAAWGLHADASCHPTQ